MKTINEIIKEKHYEYSAYINRYIKSRTKRIADNYFKQKEILN